jgi:hypothetical protein
MPVSIHPKSLPITPGWSRIGQPPRKLRPHTKREVSKAFATTLTKQANRRVAKLRHKLAQGKLSDTDLIIGVLDVSLSVRPPRIRTEAKS